MVAADEMDRPQERQWNGENERGMVRMREESENERGTERDWEMREEVAQEKQRTRERWKWERNVQKS